MYDLIGDIHGHAEPLKKLLYQMGYSEKNDVWSHSIRKVIFIGDYIDRGPAIRETLSIVRKMAETGNAIALMGNHEYNALAYAYSHNGSFLRSHNDTHNKQHSQTLNQFTQYEEEWKSYLKWFYSLKLFLDLPGLRAVHACWDHEHIKWLAAHGYDTMKEDLLIESHKRGSKAYKVIEDVLKGKEFAIPEEYIWNDKDGHPRKHNRIKWWKDPLGIFYQDFLFNCPDPLKYIMLSQEIDFITYPEDDPPVFFGHYWMEDLYPVIQSGNVVCLDYSIAKGGNLVAYRWNGERKVDNSHFENVPYREII